jgi:hypothetical protein
MKRIKIILFKAYFFIINISLLIAVLFSVLFESRGRRKQIIKINEDFISKQLNDPEFRSEIHRKYR